MNGTSNAGARKVSNKRVLVVGMTDSPHLKKWLDAVVELTIIRKILIFPSTGYEKYVKPRDSKSSTRIKMVVPFASTFLGRGFCFLLDRAFGPSWRKILLEFAILRTRPEVIHIHEIQHGGYLFQRKKTRFYPIKKVICSSWGSDLILYGKLPSHQNKIIDLLRTVDLLTSERVEEFEIASNLGFKGRFISPVYTAIGIEANPVQFEAPSKRKMILVKGYQDNHGRALNALRALELVKSDLKNFEINVVSASPAVEIEVERMRFENGWEIKCVPKQNQREIHNLLRHSRVYIGLSISDGLSTMMVEAMQFGAFPIQSLNSGAPSFLLHGTSGFIVDPWDLSAITQSIDAAISNDELVDSAVMVNRDLLKRKFDLGHGLEVLKNLYSDFK
jgi:glycosyltransferase involved in cell wall biosynthesis